MRASDTVTAVCDFCSEPAVEWDYPCRDFSLRDAAGTFNSREGWAACESCHALIQAGDREGLARRSSERFPCSPPRQSADPAQRHPRVTGQVLGQPRRRAQTGARGSRRLLDG